jgi:hypothetical protein
MDWYQLMSFFRTEFRVPFVILSDLQCFIHIVGVVLICSLSILYVHYVIPYTNVVQDQIV